MDETIIQTPRLLLRHWRESDCEPFIAMNRSPRVMRYFPEPYSREQTLALYDRIQQEFTEKGYGLYAAEERESGRFIGFIGFHQADFAADFCPCVEISWRLNAPFWNRGYATEGARACLKEGFDRLGFTAVYSFTARCNRPSERVMQKLGMEYLCEFEHPGVACGSPLRTHVCYRITPEGQCTRREPGACPGALGAPPDRMTRAQ